MNIIFWAVLAWLCFGVLSNVLIFLLEYLQTGKVVKKDGDFFYVLGIIAVGLVGFVCVIGDYIEYYKNKR